MDLSNIPFNDLLQMQRELPALIQKKLDEKIATVQAEIDGLLEQHGLTRMEVLPTMLLPRRRARKIKESAAKPAYRKFQNPNNPSEIWLGRGKQPNWLRSLVAAGHATSEFLVE